MHRLLADRPSFSTLGPSGRAVRAPGPATALASLDLSNGGLSVFLCGRLMSGAGWPVSTLSYLEL